MVKTKKERNLVKLLIFVDDLNMPQVDTYGTQQPLALLKFLIEVRCGSDAGANIVL